MCLLWKHNSPSGRVFMRSIVWVMALLLITWILLSQKERNDMLRAFTMWKVRHSDVKREVSPFLSFPQCVGDNSKQRCLHEAILRVCVIYHIILSVFFFLFFSATALCEFEFRSTFPGFPESFHVFRAFSPAS